MLMLSITLTCLGAASSVLGVYWGAVDIVRSYRTLQRDLDQLEAISQDPGISDEDKTPRRYALRSPTGNWGKLEYFEENAQLAALSLVVNNLKWPALLTALGVLISAAASVVSLWA
ncbi:hypothetical protein ACFWTC_15755 [Streptomyces sp. NPDC058619]|uniref:hypothetical protein n=1 Tax=unclassified Streptomyces TaxID=2593676 RepID=UPI0036470A20